MRITEKRVGLAAQDLVVGRVTVVGCEEWAAPAGRLDLLQCAFEFEVFNRREFGRFDQVAQAARKLSAGSFLCHSEQHAGPVDAYVRWQRMWRT